MLKGYNEDNFTERALAHLEKDICYLAHSNWGYGMPVEDVQQELRLQLFRKFHLYDPSKKALRTWAQMVMRNRLKDMDRYVKRPHRIPLDKYVYPTNQENLYNLVNNNHSDWGTVRSGVWVMQDFEDELGYTNE